MSPDTTKRVPLHITNPRTNAAAWSCHMNSFKNLNAKKLNVSAKRGAGRLIVFGSNGETAPVKSYRSATDPVTVRLFKSGSSSAAYSTVVKGNSASYTISGVTPGTYTMKVSKKNHVTREYTVNVTAGAKTQNAQIHLLGDINGDGKISTADVNKINAHVKKVSLLW